MITTAEQYNANLHLINNANPPVYATLPTADNIYNIDIKTREIDAPKFLAVEKDHISETIYFIVDRQAEFMDLATTNCVISYVNAVGKSRFYIVPFYDIYSYASENKMIIPWCLDVNVTEGSGEVVFALQFFKVGETLNPETNGMEKVLIYNLKTLPAMSKVLTTIDVKEKDLDKDYLLDANQFSQLIELINATSQHQTHWTLLD